MDQLKAVVLNSRGESTKAVLRNGPILVVALRLDVGTWEPLYAILGPWRVELPPGFRWSIEAICALEEAAVTPQRARHTEAP
jgi:hypothetical protein